MSRLIDMRDGEIVSVEETASSIPVLMHQNPFSEQVKFTHATPGTTVYQMVQQAALPAVYHDVVRVWVNDEEVPREVWGEYIPASGTNVYIRVVPQKGGKDIFRAVLMVVVAVIAWQYVGPAVFNYLEPIVGTFGAYVGGALAATAVMAIGYLAINALIPPPGLQKDKNDPKYRLTGTQNAFSPYANIPRIFGKRRLYPLHAGRPYSEIQGDDEYLRICLVVGWGPIAITEIKIGETPISAFDGVEYETREGWSNDAALTLYSKTVTEDNFSYQLEPYTAAAGTYYAGGYGYFGDFYKHDTQTDTYSTVVTTSTNGWASRTSAANATELSVDIAFPSGLFFFNSRGNREQATVQLDVQYRAVGSPTWLNVTWANSSDAGFNVAGKITVTASETSAVRRSGRIKLPSVGQYEVQMRRVTQNSGDKYVDLVWWTTLRTIKADYPILEKNLALIALRIKATGQLNGVPATINCVGESYLPTTDLTQNLNTYSSALENWSKTTGMTVTANAVTGPFGTVTADNVSNVVNTASFLTLAMTYSASTTYVRSFYAKPVSGTNVIVSRVQNTAGGTTDASFNVSTGVATLLSGAPATCSMTSVGSGWYRCIHTFTTTATPPTLVELIIGAQGATATATTISIEGVQTEQASTVGTFTATTTTAKPLWSYALSSNPAWAYCDILRRRNGTTFLADSRIDLASILAWATACATTAPNASEPRWTFNGVIEGGSVYDALRLIASNARANYTMRDGKHSVVRDILQTVPVQHITPRNSFGYSGSKTFLDYPHALRAVFVNKDKGYQDDERIVYYDGYDSTNATKFETLQLEGCTSSTQAFREARYHMAVARLRPEEHKVSMDIEALRCTVGDLVRFSHDACAIGIQSSRVKSITTSAGNVTTITLDDEIYFETGKSYVLRARLSATGDTSLVSLVNPGAGYATTLTLVTPTAIASAPGVGDLVVFGESTKETAEMIVKKIEPAEDFVVELTLVDAAPAVHTADTGTIPAWTSNLTLQTLPGSGSVPAVYISAVRSDDSVVLINVDGSVGYRMFVQMQQPEGTTERVQWFELQYKLSNAVTWETVRVERAQPFYYVDRVFPGQVYMLRVRGVTTAGAEGVWSTTVTHTILGKTNGPIAPTALTATAIPGGITLKWTDPDINDLWQTEIYENTVSNSATATVVATVTANTYDRLGLSAASGIRYYWIKAVDTSGNKSTFVGPVSATALNKGLYINITNDAVVLPASSAGVVSSFATAVGLMTVFDSDTDVTASATISAVQSNVTGTLNTAANTPVAAQPKGYYAVTAMSADTGTLTLSALYNGVTVSKVFSVTKAIAGTAGTSAVAVNLSKNAVTLQAYADGTVVSFADASGTLSVFSGATDVTASASLSVSLATNCTGTINTAANTPVNGQPKGYFQVTAMSADTASLTLQAIYNTVTYTRVFTLSKSKAGYEIVGALPSTNLFEGRIVFLTTDDKLYRYTGTAWTTAVAGSDITAGTLAATAFANTIEPITLVTSVPGTKSTNTIFNSTDGKLYRWNGSAYVASVPTADLSGTIATAQIADAALTTAKFASGIEPVSVVTGALPTVKSTNAIYRTDDGKLYRWNGSAYVATVPTGDLSGTISTAQIADAALTTAKFAASIEPVTVVSAVPGTKSTNAIFNTTDGKLYRWSGSAYVATVPTGDLSGTIGTTQIADTAITAAKFASAIEPVTLVTSVPGTKSTNTIYNSTDGKLYRWNGSAYVASVASTDVTGTLTNAQLAAIDAAKVTGQITGTQITDGAISTAKLAAGAVTANEIAATTITAAKIASGTITATQIASGTITATQIATDTITANQIAAGAIGAAEISAGAVTASKIAVVDMTNMVKNPSFQGGSSDGWTLNGGTVVQAKATAGVPSGAPAEYVLKNPLVVNTNNDSTATGQFDVRPGEVYYVEWYAASDAAANGVNRIFLQLTDQTGTGLTWPAAATTPTNSTTWTLYSGQITIPATFVHNTITYVPARASINFGAVGGASATGNWYVTKFHVRKAATAELVVDGAITTTKLAANAVTAAKIAAGTITSNEIAAGTITASNIATDTITAAQIAAGAISTSELAANAVTAAKIAAGTITATEIAGATITGAKIAANTITASNIAADTITAGEIAAGAISTTELAANAVTAAKIAAGTITATEIAGATITGAKIAATTITASNIAAGTITATEIASNTITAGQIAAGAIGATQIAAGAITVGKLAVTGVGSALNADPLAQDSSAWATSTGTPVFLTGITDAPAGSTAIANTAGAFTAVLTQDYIAVDQNRKYRLDVWLKAVVGTAGTAAIAVAWYDGAKALLQSNVAQPTGAGSPAGWTNGTYSFYFGGTAGAVAPTTWTKYTIGFGTGEAATLPSNARFMRVFLRLNQNATAAAQVAATNIRLMEKSDSDLIVDGSIVAAKIATGTITANEIAAGAVTAAKMSVTSLSSINANVGTITAGLLQNSTGSAQVDLTNAKIVFNNGTYMKVTGIGFGASSNYLEWYGPTQSSASNFAACTDANAIYYLKTTGVAYFGGTTESPKVTRTYRAQTTTFSATETVPLGVTKCVIELFGAGGGGGAGTGTGNSGGGGGSGAYCRTTVAVTAGSTFSMSLAALASGGASGGNGGSAASSTISGSLITTMTAPGGGGGVGTTGGSTAGAAAAIATGGTDSNLTGVAGTAGGAAATVAGGAGRAGYTETGADGGKGQNININTGPGQSGDNYFAILGYRVGAQAVFRYF